MPDQPALTAASDTSTSAAIMAVLNQTDVARLVGPHVPEPDWPGFHVTLGYIADISDASDTVRQSVVDALAPLADLLPLSADAFGTAVLNDDGDDEREPAAVLLVQSADLASLHDGVSDAIASLVDEDAAFPIWLAHTTVAYSNDPAVIPDGVVGTQLTFDRLVLSWGDQQIDITSSPAPAVTAATEAPVTTPTSTVDDTGADDQAVPDTSSYPDGTQWAGPLVQLDTQTGDGRIYASAGLTIRDLPLPLSYQREGTHGGEVAGTTVVVGRILTAEVRDGVLYGTGDYLDPVAIYDVVEAAARVEGELGMVSGDTGPTVVTYGARQPDGTVVAIDPMLYDGPEGDVIAVIEEWEFMGATLVADPAFGGTRIQTVAPLLDPAAQAELEPVPAPSMDPKVGTVIADGASPQDPTVTADAVTFPDGTVVKVGDEVTVTQDGGTVNGTVQSIDPDEQTVTVVPAEDAYGDDDAVGDPADPDPITVPVTALAPTGDDTDDAAVVAAAPLFPGLADEHVYPAAWFEPVALDGPTHLTITEEGRVFGHLAESGTCHLSFAECVNPPSSPSGYAYFHVGEVKTDAGMLPVGKLTVGGGHLNDLSAGWQAAVEHYDNAGAAAAVVRVHEDDHGIQVTGALVPHATGSQIAALRRNDLSGDWRPIAGQRELVGALSVNTAGFQLTPRAALAADGRPMALIAAGIVRAPAAEAEPETTGGVTLPSGVQLTSVDVAVLASAFDEVASRRVDRLARGVALRDKLRTERADKLRARVQG
ncbi:hypothetical protein [uncultured Jatrophihabitans sp.]|uniref:hypothetical protein n=1 Tax=uncultured Jatrophihabitans sp. TaxID=1610747 RepID=UPI0035CBB0DE